MNRQTTLFVFLDEDEDLQAEIVFPNFIADILEGDILMFDTLEEPLTDVTPKPGEYQCIKMIERLMDQDGSLEYQRTVEFVPASLFSPVADAVGKIPGMETYRKKPVEVQAVQWFKNGDHPEDEVGESLDQGLGLPGHVYERQEGAVVRYYRRPDVPGTHICGQCDNVMHKHGWIETLEGGHIVCPGDFIITGVQGERYPCKPDIFKLTYDGPIVSF